MVVFGGLERGYSLMIGGEGKIVKRLDPLFASIAPGDDGTEPTPGRKDPSGTATRGYLHCGPNGAGHFVKMVHNGIEYGMMASIAEGLNILSTPTSVSSSPNRTRRRHPFARPSTTTLILIYPTSPKCGVTVRSLALGWWISPRTHSPCRPS